MEEQGSTSWSRSLSTCTRRSPPTESKMPCSTSSITPNSKYPGLIKNLTLEFVPPASLSVEYKRKLRKQRHPKLPLTRGAKLAYATLLSCLFTVHNTFSLKRGLGFGVWGLGFGVW